MKVLRTYKSMAIFISETFAVLLFRYEHDEIFPLSLDENCAVLSK